MCFNFPIHLHKLHSKQWAEFAESTKHSSQSKLLQTNDHLAQIASSHKTKFYWPICFIFLCFILLCLFLILTASDRVKTKIEMDVCKTETKKDSMKWKLKWKRKYPSKRKRN